MRRVSLQDGWYVYSRDDAFSLVSSVPDDAVRTSVPYDAAFEEGQREDSVNAGRTGYFDGKVYYYHRELSLGEECRGRRLIIKFEGLFSKSFVYVNGSLVGSGDFGYASLSCDITDYVRFEAPNALLVVCKTDVLSSRWYAGTGILRPVWLMVGEPVHTVLDSLFLTTEELFATGGARVRLRATLANDTGHAQNTTVRLRIFDDEGDVANETFPVRVAKSFDLDRRLFLSSVIPWSAENPHLYWIELVVGDDVTHMRCGLRTESWDPAHGLLINGEPVLLRGACIHHDEGVLGGVANMAFERWRVGRLKQAGFNAIRSAHNHPSHALLRACDELGVFVLDEVCDMWTKMKGFGDFAQYFGHSWQQVVDSMVREDRNHPSVVGYSTGNEISDINTERGFKVAHDLFQQIHALDDTRFVTNGVNGAFAAGEELVDIAVDLTGEPKEVFETGDVNRFMGLMATRMSEITTHPVVTQVLERLDSSVDVQGYNYMTDRYAPDANAYPQRVMLGTETYPRMIAQNWEVIKRIPAAIGDFTWTGWDYIGELGGAPYPAWQNGSGDVDAFGFRRPVSYWRQIVFGLRNEPYLAVRPPEAHGTPREFGPWKFTDAVASWTWDVPAGTPMTVEAYSDDDEVELFLNGRSVGRSAICECHALLEVPYESGTLEVVGSSGRRWTLRSAAGELHVANDAFESDGWMIVRWHLEDAAGTPVPGDGRELDCALDGWELVAAGSADSLPPFHLPTIHLVGQGGVAVYRKADR